MALSNGKSLPLQPCGPILSVSPANCDVAVHVDEKAARLAALGFSSISRSSLNLKSCIFLGSVAASHSSSVLDVYADRYDCGQVNKAPNSLFPESTISLGQDDVVIPCFLNRRISKTELKQLSVSMLFPSVEERGFTPSIRDIIACCISFRLSTAWNTPRSTSPTVVTRADLRISLPTNVVSFAPVILPPQLFGGIAVADLLPPVISSAGRQIFRTGYISLRSASNRLASSMGFLLDGDVWKQGNPSEDSLLGIWISGSNGSPADDLRIYAACLRYAFDNQLAKLRLLPSLLANHRAPPSLPFSSTSNTPFFLVAIVNSSPRPDVSFYECRLSPTLQPTFTILTATTLLPPCSVSGDRVQNLKLDFILGRAASAAIGFDQKESLDDSTDDHTCDDNETDLISDPPSAGTSLRRKPPQPQPQPNLALPSVPDVSVWLPASSHNQNARGDGVTPRQITALSTPRNSAEARMQVPISEIKHSGSKSSAVSSSDFEDEWRAMRQKVEVMWHNSAQPPKLSSTLIKQANADSAVASPPQMLRVSETSANTRMTDLADGSATARTLRDACVGVGTSLLMLNSPKTNKQRESNSAMLPSSNTCSQCCSHENLATQSIASRSTRGFDTVKSGCCLFPRREKPPATSSEAQCSLRETTKAHISENTVNDKNSQYDPCSLILKWLQRCGNNTAGSSTCGEAVGPDSHSRCSSEDDNNVKTAAAICSYLNGDLTIQKSCVGDKNQEDDEDENENQFVSLSASSSSMLLKHQSCNERPRLLPSSASDSPGVSSCWTNGVRALMASEKPIENGDSFAARAREIVRQMDEWGLVPPQMRSTETSLEISMPNDISRVAGYEQIKAALEGSRFQNMSMVTDSSDSSASYGSGCKKMGNGAAGRSNGNSSAQHLSTDANVSVALPRVVALESLRLGPTNTTLMMKNLASRHLPTKDPSQCEDGDAVQKPPKAVRR